MCIFPVTFSFQEYVNLYADFILNKSIEKQVRLGLDQVKLFKDQLSLIQGLVSSIDA